MSLERQSAQGGAYSTVRKLKFTDLLDPEKIAAMYPGDPSGPFPSPSKGYYIAIGRLRNPDINKLADSFSEHVRNFQKSELCRRVRNLVKNLFSEHKVTKIVAFGLGPISALERNPHSNSAVKNHYQHGALLVIRDTWKETNQGELPIYVQDPIYSRQDEAILKKWGITVVNAEIGYQVGACLLDIFTLVVEILAIWPVSHVAFEITRPAGLLKSFPIEPEAEFSEKEAIFHYAMEPRSGATENKWPIRGSIHTTKVQKFHYFPGTGVSDAEVINEGLRDYKSEKLDLAGLDLGEEFLWQRAAINDPELAAGAAEADARNEARRNASGTTPGTSKEGKSTISKLKPTKLLQNLKGKATSSSAGPASTPHTAGKPESIKGSRNIARHLLKRLQMPENRRDHDYGDPQLRKDGMNGFTYIGPEPVLYIRAAKADELLGKNSH